MRGSENPRHYLHHFFIDDEDIVIPVRDAGADSRPLLE